MDVRGRIFATSGVFNNVTINENCDVRGKVYANRIDGDIASMQAFSAQTLRKHDGVYTYVYAGGMNYAVRLVIPNIKVVYYSSPRGSVCNMRIKLNGNILRQHRFSRVSGGMFMKMLFQSIFQRMPASSKLELRLTLWMIEIAQ